jgi:hypothetical protein
MVTGINSEDRPKMLGINGLMADGQKQSYDFTKGRHEVRVTTSQSFATKREESAAFLTDLVNKQPQMMQVMGDLLFKYMDVAGAEAMADRMRKVIPPNLTQDDDEQDPEKMQLMQAIQQMQQQLQQAQMMLEEKNSEKELKAGELQIKAQDTQVRSQAELAKLEQSARQSEQDAQLKAAELQLKSREIAIKEQELQLKAQQMQLDAVNIVQPEREEQDDNQKMAVQVAMLQAISDVRGSIDALSAQISQPKTVIYDENGMIAGVQ